MRRTYGLFVGSAAVLLSGFAPSDVSSQYRNFDRERKEAARVEAAVEARFAEIDNGFGMVRVAPATEPHIVSPRPNVHAVSPPDDLLVGVYVDGVRNEKYTKENGVLKFVGFMNLRQPTEFRRPITTSMPGDNKSTWAEKDKAFRAKFQKILVTGGEAFVDGQFVYVRPVTTKRECLRCHTTSKVGDALGSVGVSVRNIPPPRR